jgi:hypothetical protein
MLQCDAVRVLLLPLACHALAVCRMLTTDGAALLARTSHINLALNSACTFGVVRDRRC